MIEASNLLMVNGESQGEVWGCFCTRYIKSDDVDVAVVMAKELIISELHERGILCDEKQFFIESVKILTDKPDDAADKGFTFYPMDDSNPH